MRQAFLLIAAAAIGCGSETSGSSQTSSAGSTGTSTTTSASATSSATTSGSAGTGGSSGAGAVSTVAVGGMAGGGGTTTSAGGAAGSAGTPGTGGSGSGLDAGSDTSVPPSDASDARPGDAATDSASASDAKSDATVTDAGPSRARQTARPTGTTSAKNGFWEYLPPGYGDGTPRPLLVFWHGAGEAGTGNATDLMRVLAHGPPKIINANQWPANRTFVVLSPQAPTTPASADSLHDFFTFALANYTVDPSHTYLTGLSNGARASSSYLGKYTGQQVAAAVLIAGDASIAFNAAGCPLINQVAIWSFHGDADPTVLPGPDMMGMASLKACAGQHKEATYTSYPGVAHDSWTRTYDLSAGHQIYDWLLTQSR